MVFVDDSLGVPAKALIKCRGELAKGRAPRRDETRRIDVMEEYERLRELVEAAADDVRKATGGNKAAGTRVRKSMQQVKDAAQTVRKKILEVRAEEAA